MTKKIPDLYITLSSAARLLKVDRGTIRRMIERKELDGYKKEGNYRGSWHVSFLSCMEHMKK